MIRLINLFFHIFAVVCLFSCRQTERSGVAEIEVPDSSSFSEEIRGKQATLYVLTNHKGMEVALTNFGARIVSLIVPDKEDKKRDVVLGFDNATSYDNLEEPYFGTVVGPYGNRIANGKFTLKEETYQLPINNGPNTLHGGINGVHFEIWNAQQLSAQAVVFSLLVPDGQEGFPGNRELKVTYSVNDENELMIEYEGRTDKTTVLNLTNHAYFNLNGEGSGSVENHLLQIFAEHYTPVDSTLIPTGEIKGVAGSAFDFTQLKEIGKDIASEDEQLNFGKGYDHNFVLNETKHGDYNYACRLIGDQSGIIMEVFTEEPGLQFYSGNFMADKVTLKSGVTDSFRTGLCLETQHFPDSPNQPLFPTTTVDKGEVYSTKSIYKFSTL